MTLAVDAAVLWVGLVGVIVAVVAIVVIVAPWKGVRDEHPLPDDVETRLLLGEDPEVVAADVDRADDGGAAVVPIDAGDEQPTTDGDAAYSALEHLDEPAETNEDDV